MKPRLTAIIIVLLIGRGVSLYGVKSVAGDLRLHVFNSAVFGNTRTLRVLVPTGYDNLDNRSVRYPVLYLNDGQNLFDAETSQSSSEWCVDETVNVFIRETGNALIVVGIDNIGKSERGNEYLPFEDVYLSPPIPDPQGSKYPDFLTAEVMPFIDSRYRTLTGPENTALGGSSYGALIALYAGIRHPDKIGRLLLESPSLYVSEGAILEQCRDVSCWPRRLYIGIGTNEAGTEDCDQDNDINREAVADVSELERILRSAGLNNDRILVVYDECAVHSESAWAERFPRALRFVFGKSRP